MNEESKNAWARYVSAGMSTSVTLEGIFSAGFGYGCEHTREEMKANGNKFGLDGVKEVLDKFAERMEKAGVLSVPIGAGAFTATGMKTTIAEMLSNSLGRTVSPSEAADIVHGSVNPHTVETLPSTARKDVIEEISKRSREAKVMQATAAKGNPLAPYTVETDSGMHTGKRLEPYALNKIDAIERVRCIMEAYNLDVSDIK
jgi:hypothetical protein